ncbi:MAG: hypothetical protein A2X64_07200 [Ignavibacteria bacterium GWF2_33_9]|nr:MAG: hypothetical protein A2X64_07200 [Ignavibacteria bacterium GWF2_33_9]
MKKFLYSLFIFLSITNFLHAEDKNPEVGIVEKLGNQIPMDLTFTADDGTQFQLKDVIDKPTVLSLVFYHCTSICSPLLGGLVDVVEKTDLVPGKDYQLLTIGFDHKETFHNAKSWKDQHLKLLQKKIPSNSWIYTAGDSVSIRKLTDAVGFYFKSDGKDGYIHGASILILTPTGKISHYIFGTEFNPVDFKTAILAAQEGIELPTIAKVLKFCFSYDVKSRRYVLNITTVIGLIMLVSAGIFLVVLITKKRKKTT